MEIQAKLVSNHILRPLKNAPFCPISASGSNFNPRNTSMYGCLSRLASQAGWLKFSPSLTLNKIKRFSKVSSFKNRWGPEPLRPLAISIYCLRAKPTKMWLCTKEQNFHQSHLLHFPHAVPSVFNKFIGREKALLFGVNLNGSFDFRRVTGLDSRKEDAVGPQ